MKMFTAEQIQSLNELEMEVYLCEHQVISFYLAEMAAEIDIARNMLYNVCRMKDAGLDYIAEAAAVKVFASEMCVRISEKCLQMHGGNGYSREFDVERFYRDAKLLEIGEGTSEILRLVISGSVIGR